MKPTNPQLAHISNDDLLNEMVARQSALFARMQAAIGLFQPTAVAAAPAVPVAAKAAKSAPAKKTPAAAPAKKTSNKIINEKPTNQYVLDALRSAGGPVKAAQIVESMENAGWKTTSDNPKSIVYTNLQGLEKKGIVVQAADKAWALGANADVPVVKGKRGRKAKSADAPAATPVATAEDGTAIDNPGALLGSMEPVPAAPAPAANEGVVALNIAPAAPPALRDGETLVQSPNGVNVIRRPGRAEDAADST